jgi:hypothetical protein
MLIILPFRNECKWKNLPPVSLIPLVHLDMQNHREFLKKFEKVLMEYFGAEEKLIHKKTSSKKNLGPLSLKVCKSADFIGSGFSLS